ncbi:aldolase/citrate lyase family protein [Roseobacter sp. N2S]|uniref:HpcH/HpaI aldolase family protein n=1 Tax=Roseobacter sp. N2S TaxID=2663844 RepID=UPI002858F57E|nr:aldolase/citrate lyase family protein [Roseobacter sp. N2S]MDR6264199.1 4-hydroxy-2-oxoheptanedioate aldolase [Roseobacter sp. N2S]
MNHPPNTFLDAIRAGQQQIGLWVSLGSGFSAEAIAGAGFDWLLIDMEHAPTELGAVFSQMQALAAYDGTVVVRPPWNDTVMVKRLLDAGASNLLFPMVQNPDEAASAVSAMRYPPHGVRGVSGLTRATRFGRVKDYFVNANDRVGTIVQVETRAAMEQIDQIGTVDGVDGVFFGPADIGADMGILGNPNHPDIWEAIRPVAKKLMDKGIPVGTLVFDAEFAKKLLGEGFTFVACGSDLQLLTQGANQLIAKMRG